MILPTKRLNQDRALLSVGGQILKFLDEAQTVSRLWDRLRKKAETDSIALSYDWFVLALDFLYTINAIEWEQGKIRKIKL